MTLEEYMKIARDTQYTKDLTKELVENIYYSIKSAEIKIPEENPDDSINGIWLYLFSMTLYQQMCGRIY
jgi:Sec7-like guanine-nucleotide exchange factor